MNIEALIQIKDNSAEIEMNYNGSPAAGMLCWLDGSVIKEWWKASEASVEPEVGGLFYISWNVPFNNTTHAIYGVVDKIDTEQNKIRITKIIYVNPYNKMEDLELSIEFEPLSSSQTIMRLSHLHKFSGADKEIYNKAVMKSWPKTFSLFKQFVENKMTA